MKDTTIFKKSLKIADSTEVTVPTSRSNAGPTPGHWTVTGFVVWSPGAGRVVAGVSEPDTRSGLAEYEYPSIGSPRFHEICANARLIAAAPAMAEALRKAVSYFGPLLPKMGWVDEARSVLAQATGEVEK